MLEYRRYSLGSIFDGLGIGETSRDYPIPTETMKAITKAKKATTKAIKAKAKVKKAKEKAEKAKEEAIKAKEKAETWRYLARLDETKSTLARLEVPWRDQKCFVDTKLKSLG